MTHCRLFQSPRNPSLPPPRISCILKKTPYNPPPPNAEQVLSLSQQLPVSQRFLHSLSQSLWLHTCHSSQVSAAAKARSAPVPHLSVTAASANSHLFTCGRWSSCCITEAVASREAASSSGYVVERFSSTTPTP